MAEHKDKAYTFIFNEILDKILQLSENPSQFADYLTQQIREIIGARTIVIAIKNANQQTEIYSVFPARRKEWVNQSNVSQLIEISFAFENIQFFEKKSPDLKIASLLQELDIEKTIAIPLIASGIKVGTILLFDIMDLFGIEAVLDLLNRLSGISALIIRNSVLYHNLEETIALRTHELQKRNEELNNANLQLKENITHIQDINSQLEESKQKAVESEINLQTILSSTTDIIASYDLNICLITYNKACSDIYRNLFGVEIHQGLYTLDLFPESTRDFWIHNNSRAIAGETFSIEINVPTTNGELIFEQYYNPIFKDGKVVCFSTFTRNITEKKRIEIELITAKNKAEESDRLKTAFLQNMSHEIRTPMNAIMGFSDLLVKNFDNKNKLQKFSDIIGQRCNDLLDIINDILDIAKIESGQLPLNHEECNLKELFEELSTFFNEYQIRLGKQQIEFSLQALCDPCDYIIITDKGKLKQIFINLIGNAFKFTEYGKIEGGCKFDENNNLLFYVSDTGIGIPADKQEMVFERFAQVHQGSKLNIGGTGLGLPIVKGLVGLLGGQIFLESEPEKGSTFSFTFPFSPSTKGQHKQSNLEPTNINVLSNKTILIVEDDLYNAEYLKEILSDNGLNILHSMYGKEAVYLSLSQPIDIVLMDIRLPDMNGYEATKQIKNHKPNMKIIAQTAYAAQGEKQKAFDAGCCDYLSKPTKQEVLIAMLNKYLSL